MSTPQHFVRLFAFTRWVNAKMLEPVARLSPEEYGRPVGGSFGSIQGTLAHVFGADWVWLERFHGRSPRELPPGSAVPTLHDLLAKWRPVEEGHRQYVGALTPGHLDESLTYVNFAGQTWTYRIGDVLMHVTNHATYHRGQVATLLRQVGQAPVSTDYLRFLDAGG